jgi:hypothetical protein
VSPRSIYFVLLGLANGERGEVAQRCGGGAPGQDLEPDGWYWVEEGMADGVGPFPSREDAVQASLGRLDPSNCIVPRAA